MEYFQSWNIARYWNSTFILLACLAIGSICAQNGEQLKNPPTHFIVAPTRIRPNQEVQILVSILHLTHPSIEVKASIKRLGMEYGFAIERFYDSSTRTLQIKIPETAKPGNYTLRVEGKVGGGLGTEGVLFVNETQLEFYSKQASVFIQTDRVLYPKKGTVNFRVIALTPHLLPVMMGTLNIYVRDCKNIRVRRWLMQQFNNGIYEGSFQLAFPINFCWWTIEVETMGQVYTQRLLTRLYFWERFDVNVTTPRTIFDQEFALAGTVTANRTNGHPVKGNATIELEIYPPGVENSPNIPKLIKTIPLMNGVGFFHFPLEQIKKYSPTLGGTRLKTIARVYDWFYLTEQSGHALTYIYQNRVRLRFLGGRSRIFKPGQSFDIYIAAYEEDGGMLQRSKSRLLYVQRIIQRVSGGIVASNEEIFIIGDDSMVHYSYTPVEGDLMITIRAKYGSEGGTIDLIAYKHYTESQHYITLTSSTHHPSVNEYMLFTVTSTTYIPEIYYIVTVSGNIITWNKLFMKGRQKTVSFAVSQDMIPKAHIVVYGILLNGEVLSDSLNFYVNGIQSNGLKVEVNKGKNFQKNTMEINAATEGGTYTAFSAMDYELYRKGHNRFFTKFDVENDLNTYDNHTSSSFSHTWYYAEERKENVHFNAASFAVDANTTFLYSGMTVFTDADLTRIPTTFQCNDTKGFLACYDGSCYAKEQKCDGVRQCEDGSDEMGCSILDETIYRPDPYAGQFLQGHHLDKSSFAWKHFYTKPYGRIDFKVSIPKRPTTWLIGGFALSREKGLLFNEYPARLDTTRMFYIVMELPSSAVRGEQLGAQVTAFNYWDQPLEVLLILEKSSKYKFVKVTDTGIVSSYDPDLSDKGQMTMVYLRPREVKYIHFPILPTVMGPVTVTVHAESVVSKQTVRKTVNVRMDGVTNVYHTPYFIDLVSQGSLIIPNLDIPVPFQFFYPEQREHLYVPGSEKATVSVVGDVVGPGLYKDYLYLQSFTSHDDGSGDDYVFNFAYNLYWLKFLRTLNQLSESKKVNSLKGMNKELQIIYRFLGKGGGIAMRWNGDYPMSVWITAFALESFSDAIDPEWEDILYIDEAMLTRMADWLMDQQNVTTGEFIETHRIYDKKLEPVLLDGDDTPLNIPVTAYAAVALAKCTSNLLGPSQSRAIAAKNFAAEFLSKHFDRLTQPFHIAIVTYALHVTNHVKKGQAFKKLRSIKREDEFIYWSRRAIPPNPTEIVNTVHFQQPRPLPLPFDSEAVQATGYALMVYLINNWYMEAEPIMEWLQTQRQRDGAFNEIQDTIIATRALQDYAERDTNKALYRMLINLESTSSPQFKPTVSLEQGEFLDYHTYRVPEVWGSVKATAFGTGRALLQLTTEVNVEYPWQMRQFEERSFDLEVDQLNFYGRNSSTMYMNVCVRWVRLDLGNTSGSSMIVIEIPTGFVVEMRTLKKHQTRMINRFRFSRGKVMLFFDYLDNNRNCFDFTGERWYPVANSTIQHSIRVYDTHNPGLQNHTLYTTYNLFHLHICQVCGSFQCPYCPWYNTGTTWGCHCILIVLLLLIFSEGYS